MPVNSPTSTAQHPPGCYYVNIATGTIQRQCNPLLAASLGLAGYFGTGGVPATATNAFPTFAAAQQFAGSQTGSAASGDIAKAAQAPLSGINAVGDFFQRLTQPATWIRVAEFLAGGLLLYLGASAALRGTAAGNAAKQGVSTGKRLAEYIPK